MKYVLFLLLLNTILLGCSIHQIDLEPTRSIDSEPTRLIHSDPSSTPPIFTHLPLKQTLNNTTWHLLYAEIKGERQNLHSYERYWISFSEKEIRIYDGCNGRWYESEDENLIYIADEDGHFELPKKGTESSFTMTLEGCMPMLHQIGDQIERVELLQFMPRLKEIVAYEIQDDQLWLYYPESKENILVLSQEWPGTPEPQATYRSSVITVTPAPTFPPEPTLTAGPTKPPPTPRTPYP